MNTSQLFRITLFNIERVRQNLLSLLSDICIKANLEIRIVIDIVSSLTREKYLDVDDIVIFVMSDYYNFVIIALLLILL